MTRSRVTVAAAVVVALAVVVVVVVASGLGGRLGIPDVPGGAPADGTCTAAAGARESDVDTDDSEEYPWAREPGQKATVYFETGALPARYAEYVEQGAQLWSRSACVQAVAVARCPAGANCSTVVVAPGRGDDGETDGESEGTERGDVRVANVIRLYPAQLAETTDNGVLVTVVHEMGHALGLRHRLDPDAMMNASTGDDTDPAPDGVDFANLVAVYGTENG